MLAFLSPCFTLTLPRLPPQLPSTLFPTSKKATSEAEKKKEHISWLHNFLLFFFN